MITHWKTWNQQGLIPGPNETEEAFLQRVIFCQNLKHEFLQWLGKELPFSEEDQTNQYVLEEAWPLTKELYGIAPTWVPLFFNNYQLAPWHGGCAWIFQFDPSSPTSAFLQLRKHFQTAALYLGIYQRKELIAHEIAHVGRMAYEEPQFEEIFAYQTSFSRWRQWLGPLFQSDKETLLFSFFLFIPLIVSMIFTLELKFAFMLFILPFAFLFFGLGRLYYRHQLLRDCQKNLEALYSNPSAARHLLYRLRDSEIREFAALPPTEIKAWIKARLPHSFRWQFLNTLYPLSTLTPKE